mmetsp:Transcript_8581/g.26851  ORF Transcript_8581/g.26851 Transcript_8581/m.26851 type:complete len:121 (+) Transcript_8581:1311-1673(+)
MPAYSRAADCEGPPSLSLSFVVVFLLHRISFVPTRYRPSRRRAVPHPSRFGGPTALRTRAARRDLTRRAGPCRDSPLLYDVSSARAPSLASRRRLLPSELLRAQGDPGGIDATKLALLRL